MIKFLIPLLLSNLLQSIGQVFGMIVVGHWLGVNALAAISAFFPLLFLLISFAIGIGSGSSILIGQAYGAKLEERLKAIVGTTLSFTFILGLILAIIGSIFSKDILIGIGTPENILNVSVHYARILFWSMPIMFLYIVYTTLMRGTGDSKTPFYFLVLSTILNVVLMPILVFGWFGLPKLDLYGAAYASLISTILTFVTLLIYLYKTKHPLQLNASRKYLRMDIGILKLLLKLGIPTSINMIFLSLSEIAVISFVNKYGSDATAAYGVANQLVSYVQMPALCISITVSIFAAQSIGANQFERLNQVIRVGILLNYVLGGITVILTYLLAKPILHLFLTSQTTIQISHSLLMITLWSYLIIGHSYILTSTMRSSGTVLWPTILSILSIWGIEVPVAYLLSHYTNLGIKGIWIGYPAAFIVGLGLQYLYYRLVWKKKRLSRLVI
ncbi:MATE family efflux transporter [Bacillus sp. RG28]|uniref:MATE family efflux transporter n=1 Tax=Gottfriedia endophytica TaxID=2820819 RepID=A0A940SF95_9BACI|nr:MATE family efflux transporter [Gottfriedia endophytica]MBP0723737.1 MATE family efflux transporter [Gottfriedia endophytica]